MAQPALEPVVEGVWSVLWNGNWRPLPCELNHRLSELYRTNQRAVVVQVSDLFDLPGRYLFNLNSMTVTDATRKSALELKSLSNAPAEATMYKELFDNFMPQFPVLKTQGATTVKITVAQVRDSFSELMMECDEIPARFVSFIGSLSNGDLVCEKVNVARPKTISREDLGDSYSDRLYLWVWNRVMDIGAVPTAAVPGVQLRNVIFVNNPTQLKRFIDAVGKLDVSHPPQAAAASPPSALEAAMKSLCTEHPFLQDNKGRIALMMHITSDDKERVILSCGFSMELNKEESPVGHGIVFTSDHRHAVVQYCQERFIGVGKACVIFSWVAMGEPYFVHEYTKNPQPRHVAHFALTRNGTSFSADGAKLDTPVVVSFEPELCCPFAVAELDLIPSSPSKQTNAKQISAPTSSTPLPKS